MTAELLAIGLQIGITLISGFLFVIFYKREKKEVMESFNVENIKGQFIEIVDEKFNIEELKTEFTEIVDERLQSAIDSIGEVFGGILSEPTVKKAFSIIGSQGGDAKATNSAVDSMAKDILNGPKFSTIKMGAEMIGVDIDDYIERYGAQRAIEAAKQLGGLVGIDIMNLDLGTLALPGTNGSPGGNPYFK